MPTGSKGIDSNGWAARAASFTLQSGMQVAQRGALDFQRPSRPCRAYRVTASADQFNLMGGRYVGAADGVRITRHASAFFRVSDSP